MRLFANRVMFLLLLSTTVSMAGPIYTWQDAQGRIHYSDRPIGEVDDVKQIDLETQVPAAQNSLQSPADNLYSIRNQVEYFDRRKEAERQAWLERQKLIQTARAQELQAQQLEQEAEKEEEQSKTVIINSSPWYRPYYRYPHSHPHQRGVQVQSPYALQLLHQGDNHRFNLNFGNRYPSYPLNFWKH